MTELSLDVAACGTGVRFEPFAGGVEAQWALCHLSSYKEH